MSNRTSLRIERKPQTLNRYGLSRSTFHNRIKEGLIPPPIALGPRAVGWPEHETTTVIQAIISGKSPDAIRAIVTELVAQRESMGV